MSQQQQQQLQPQRPHDYANKILTEIYYDINKPTIFGSLNN